MKAHFEVKDGKVVNTKNIWGWRKTGVGGYEFIYGEPKLNVNDIQLKVKSGNGR